MLWLMQKRRNITRMFKIYLSRVRVDMVNVRIDTKKKTHHHYYVYVCLFNVNIKMQ